MKINTYLSIITLNVSELTVPVKRHRVAEQIEKQNKTKNKTHIYTAYRRLTSDLKTHID